MIRRRTSVATLTVGGVLGAHQLAYRVDHLTGGSHSHQIEHGYLASIAAIVLPTFLVGLGWLVGSREGRATALPRASALAIALVGAFLVQELAERMVGGVPAQQALGEPVLWWGVLFQGLVALGLVAMTRAGRAVVGAIANRNRTRRHPRTRPHPHLLPRSAMVAPLPILGSLSRRGPPPLPDLV